ncbi:hypothetical protein SAMN05444959_1521, partial [Paracoccus seriniphilus]
WAEAVWKLKSMVYFREAAGGMDGGFH